MSVSANLASKQFRDLSETGLFNDREMENMAGLRQHVPLLQALVLITEYARPAKMNVELQMQIQMQGTISTVEQIQKAQKDDVSEHYRMLDLARLDYLKYVNDEYNYPHECPFVPGVTLPYHDYRSCAMCQNAASQNLPDEDQRTGEPVNEATFLKRYCTNQEALDLIHKLKHCKCCYRHQLNRINNKYTLPDDRILYDLATGEELNKIRMPIDGDVITSITVYPNTKKQARLPECYHSKCNCKCLSALSSLMVDMQEYFLYEEERFGDDYDGYMTD